MAYSDKVLDHYNNPRNVGTLDKGANDVGTGVVGAPECGDVMKLQIQVEGDKVLFNQYGVILVNPAKHPAVKKELGQSFIDWVTGEEGQKTINSYKLNGQQLFFANAS